MSIIDDASRFSFIALLKKKSDAFEAFTSYVAAAELKLNRKLKAVRSDGSGEYMNARFAEFFQRMGISHKQTICNSPESDGVSERYNQMVMNVVCAMLLESGLPKTFWGEAVKTATYIRNRTLTHAVEGKTPYEAFTGESPSLKHMRIFGSKAFIVTNKNERNKLSDRSYEVIFTGYEKHDGHYRFYDPTTRKIIREHNVIFKEHKRIELNLVEEPTPLENEPYVSLDFNTISLHQENENKENNVVPGPEQPEQANETVEGEVQENLEPIIEENDPSENENHELLPEQPPEHANANAERQNSLRQQEETMVE